MLRLLDQKKKERKEKMHSPGLTTAGEAPAVTLSPLACATTVFSVPDMAVYWKT